MPSEWQEQRIECIGGLESTQNHLLMSSVAPGIATSLINYEVAPSGGYARILGYEKFNPNFPEVGVGVAEGAVLGIFHYEDSNGDVHYYAARKDIGTNTYTIWEYQEGLAWVAITLPATRFTVDTGRSISRLRYKLHHDGATNWLIVVDGVNEALIYDGTTWREIDPANSGSTTSPGGANALMYPNYVAVFERHLFLARCDSCAKAIVAYSAPDAPYDWTTANGAGQILPSFDVEQIYPFRDALFVFGENKIGRVIVESATFTYKDVTSDVGLSAPDTVHEMGSSLVFLAPDGFRPIAGTDRINDVEISPVTEPVRNILTAALEVYPKESFTTILLHRKNQLRMNWGGDYLLGTTNDNGFIMGTRLKREGGFQFESGELFQFNFWCGFSEVIEGTELTLHGGYDGIVYKDEVGNSFDGSAMTAIFAGPFQDQGTVIHRKSYKEVHWFMRLDFEAGDSDDQTFYMGQDLDWDKEGTIDPADYIILTGVGAAQYNNFFTYNSGAKYAGRVPAVATVPVEGSGYSIRTKLVTNTITPRVVIFGYVITYHPEGVN